MRCYPNPTRPCFAASNLAAAFVFNRSSTSKVS